MPRMMFDFVDGGSGRELALRRNQAAFANLQLQPRVLGNTDANSNTEGRMLGKTILDEQYGLPFGVAPMGMCNLTWPGADCMLAAAALRYTIPLCVSAAASTRLDALHRQSGRKAWFQLYVGDSMEATWQMVKRAQEAGYTHLILTADVPRLARRLRDLKNGFYMPFRFGMRQFFDFAMHPRWSIETLLYGIPRPMNFCASGNGSFVRNASREAANWIFLDQLRARWKGKLIVKGVLSPQDAQRIQQAGVDAIYVSNHGGRQLDSAPPAILMLARIRAAVGAEYPLIFDSGIRSGEDIVKALALGADFVMLGRPFLYAIGADGARGLATLIDILEEEINMVLAQLGVRQVGDLNDTQFVSVEQPPIVTEKP